jgi:3',5'-cyclic-AMP phosphodiesterase
MTAKVIQITDLHLFEDKQEQLRGLTTWATFAAVIDDIRQQHSDFDLLVISGDIAQDEALPTYVALREALGDWLARCHLIPGNHDNRTHLRTVFPERFQHREETLNFAVSVGGWSVFGLDSQVSGEVFGRIDDDQLEWLEAKVENANGPAVVFVHHHPQPIDVAWIDKIGIRDAESLTALLGRSTKIRAVCAGHVHQEANGSIGNAEFYTTPSTCIQFGDQPEQSVHSEHLGYRILTLDGDEYFTEVRHIPVPD